MGTYVAQKFSATQIPSTITFVAGKESNRPQSNTIAAYATTAAIIAVTGIPTNLTQYAVATDSGSFYVSPIGTTVYSKAGDKTETVVATSGAIGLDNDVVFLDSTAGVSTSTLAAGSVGQEITIIMSVDGGDNVLTPASYLNGTTVTFDDAGDSIVLKSNGTNWYSVGTPTATVA